MKRRNADLICTDAEAYALGALEPDEARAFAAHLETGCAQCAAALEDYGVVVEMLGQVAAAMPVATRVRDRVLGDHAVAKVEVPGQHFVRSDERGWVESGFEGIQFRTLSEDRQRGRRTFMVRMCDGAALPPHRHEGIEEIFLIEGHLRVSGIDMRGGDYCRAEGGSVHEVAVSDGGCVFLVNGSTGDRVIRSA